MDPLVITFNALLDIAIAVGTIAAALAAYYSVKEVEKTRKDDHMPILIVSSERSIMLGVLADCKFRNIGRGIARNISAHIMRDEEQLDELIVKGIITVPVEKVNQDITGMITNFPQTLIGSKRLILKYQDIYNRSFETHHHLANDGRGWSIKTDLWDFKSLTV